MIRIDERIIAGLTVRIDRTLCVGFGDCVDIDPESFALDDEGIAIFRSAGPGPRELLLAACDACPVDAITVLDENGIQIVP